MATAVVSFEGVIAHPVGKRLIPEGARLYTALKASGAVVLTTAENRERVVRWLDVEGLPQPDSIEPYMFGDELSYLRGVMRYHIDLVVDCDPEFVAQAVERGYNTLLFTHAEFAQPQWRPDAADRIAIPWTNMVERIERDKIDKAADNRLKEQDDDGR